MNIRKILISEQEKKSILGLYNDSKVLVNEQFNSTDGTYTVQNDQILLNVVNDGKNVIVPKGTKAWHNFNSSDSKIYLGNTGVYYDCSFDGYENIFNVEDTYGTVKNDPLSKVIRSTFCNGKKIKTWEEITGKKTSEVINKSKTKCEFVKIVPTDEQLCYLSGDTKYVYAKKDGEYYTSRITDKKKWCKLSLPKWKTAVDKLNASGCKSIKEILSFVLPTDITDNDTMVPPTANNVNSQPVDKQQSQPNTTNNNLAVTNKPLDTEIGI
jgi:hypothetical protein